MSGNIRAQQVVEKKSVALGSVSVSKEHQSLQRLVVRNIYDVLMQIGAFEVILGINPKNIPKASITLKVSTAPGIVTISDGIKTVTRRRRDGKGNTPLEVRFATIQLLLGKNYLENNWNELLEENKKREKAIAKSMGMKSESDSGSPNEESALKNSKSGKENTYQESSDIKNKKTSNTNKDDEGESDAAAAAALALKGSTEKNTSGADMTAIESNSEKLPPDNELNGNEVRNREKWPPDSQGSRSTNDPVKSKEAFPSSMEKASPNLRLPIQGNFTPQVKEVLPPLKASTFEAVQEFFLHGGINQLEGTNEDVIATSTHLQFLTFGLTWRSLPIPEGTDLLSKLFLEVDAEVMKAIKTDGYDVSLGKNLRGFAATEFSSSLQIGLGAAYETVFLGALKGLGEGLTLQEITTYSASAEVRYKGSIFKAPASLGLSYGLILLGQNNAGEDFSGSVIRPKFEVKINKEWGLNLGGRLYQLEGKRKELGTSTGSVRQIHLDVLYYF